MARLVFEGRFNVYVATTIADITAPTVAEITAATDITCFLTKDGFQPTINTNNVDSAALCDTFDGMIPGSFGSDLSLTGFKDDPTDEFWNLVVYGQEAFIIAEPFGTAGVLPAAGDPVYVWHGAWHQKAPANSAANTQQTFTVSFPSTELELDAVVAS